MRASSSSRQAVRYMRWEKKNKRERAEYERLKSKFNG
jgi:hypothetical protein